jgi:ABC-type transport system involved in cytochrome c biogenesis permease component
MTFLPIVERELRVRARMKSTYRFRLGAAIGAIVLAGMVLGGGSVKITGQNGFIIFSALSWLSFVYCLIDGARNTADCLSEEKRSGTLGLLFLTDLRPYDVVLGKLMATSLNSFYGLLAIFPPLAIPLVVGGVTLGEFWRAVLVLMSTLFFSVSIGLAVSSACRDERRAWMSTVGILALVTVIPPLFLLSPAWSASPVTWFSPTTAFLQAFDSRYSAAPEQYWTSVGIVLSLSWAALFAAMIILPRSWQDRPSSSAPAWWQRWTSRIAPRVEPGDFAGRAAFLESNPIVWLASRGGTRQTLLLTVVGAVALISVMAWLLTSGATSVAATLFGVMFLVHLTVSVSVASEACHLFSGARESGAMELLLCTPMTAKEVVEGHVLGLRKMFYKPVAALVTIEAVLVAGQVYVLGGSGYSLAGCILILMLAGLCILGVVMDLAAVARYGLWQGLVNRKPAKAVTCTVLWVLLVPLIPVLCSAGILLPLIWPLKNLMFINYAREQLRRQFRSSITERAGWSEESEFIVEPTNKARPNALPPVLGR